MTDVKQEGTPSSKAETVIPKERLDEALQRAKKAEEEKQLLGQLLNQALSRQPQRRVKEVDPPYLAKMKEENPEQYAIFKAQQAELSQIKAALFQTKDEADRAQFLSAYPQKQVERWLPVVEQKLQEMRQSGEFGWTRDMIYKHLRGVDSITRDFDALSDQYEKQQEAPAKTNPKVQEDAPSSDPTVSQIARSGSATTQTTGFSIDEFEQKYGDQTL